MFRRFVHTLLGAAAGYLVGAVVGMVAFSTVYGFRSISVLEESNRNRWTFVAASAGAVVGALVAWWRSYAEVPADDGDRAQRDAATKDPDAAGPGDADVDDRPAGDAAGAEDAPPEAPADGPRPDATDAPT